MVINCEKIKYCSKKSTIILLIYLCGCYDDKQYQNTGGSHNGVFNSIFYIFNSEYTSILHM